MADTTSKGAGSTSIPRVWPFRHSYYGWAIVAASFLASVGEVPVFAPVLGVFITPIEEELGWSRTTIAWAFTIGSATGSLSAVVVGRLVDRYGARMIVVVGGMIVVVTLTGLSRVSEPWEFWALFGVGRAAAIGGIEIGTSVAVANWFVRKRGRALAIKGMGQRTGQALLPLIILAVMAVTSWRAAFVVLAGLTAVFVVLPSMLLLRRRPEDLGLLPDGAEAPRTTALAPDRQVPEEAWTLAEARRTRSFWMIVGFSMGTPFIMGSVNLHLVANFQDKGLPDGLAVSVVSIFAATSALSILPWGLLLERIPVHYGAVLMAGLLVLAIGIIGVADTYPLAVAFGVVFGLAAGVRTIIETMMLASYFGRASLGTIRGFAAPFRLLAPMGPVVAGLIHDSTGTYGPAFALFGAIAVLMVVVGGLATPPKRGAGRGGAEPLAL